MRVRAARSRADGVQSVVTDLSVFLYVPLPMETVSPEWACIQIGLVISFAVGTLEGVGARIAFFGFKSRWVNFVVSFTTPTKLPVVFRFVRTVALYTLGSLDAT